MLAGVKLCDQVFHLIVRLDSLFDDFIVVLDVFLDSSNLDLLFLDGRLELVSLLLLSKGEVRDLVLLLCLKFNDFGRQHIVAVVYLIRVFLDLFKLLLERAQLVLVICLLLLSFFEA